MYLTKRFNTVRGGSSDERDSVLAIKIKIETLRMPIPLSRLRLRLWKCQSVYRDRDQDLKIERDHCERDCDRDFYILNFDGKKTSLRQTFWLLVKQGKWSQNKIFWNHTGWAITLDTQNLAKCQNRSRDRGWNWTPRIVLSVRLSPLRISDT